MKKNRSIRGYSLLELLIVLAIFLILSGISYRFYVWHAVTTRRADAQLSLLKLSSALENYYLQHNTYSGATFENLHLSNHSLQGFYEMSFRLTAEGQSYIARATPIGSQAKQDQACGSLLLMTDGRRSYEGNDSQAVCW